MHKCLICGREFKNMAGLTGHMRMIHPSAATVDGHELKARLEAVEAQLHAVEDTTRMLSELSSANTKALINSFKIDRDRIGVLEETLAVIVGHVPFSVPELEGLRAMVKEHSASNR